MDDTDDGIVLLGCTGGAPRGRGSDIAFTASLSSSPITLGGGGGVTSPLDGCRRLTRAR